jgi:hypothetical protein
MDTMRFAGLAIVLGVVVFWIGNLYSPPGVYQETNTALRLEAVNKYPTRWVISQGLGGVGMAIIILGLLLYGQQMSQDRGPWLTYLPSGLNILAIILAFIWLYNYITNPGPIFDGRGGAPLLTISAVLMLLAALLYGLLFVAGSFPAWIGYLTIGYSIIALLALLIARPPVFMVLSFYFFVLVVPAVAMIRR